MACGQGDARKVKLGAPVRTVIIEKPQVYRANLSKGDPNDLITLAIRVGRYAEHFEHSGARVALALPKNWKGQQPKSVTEARARRDLSPSSLRVALESLRYVAASSHNDVWDAIGLGLAAFDLRLWA